MRCSCRLCFEWRTRPRTSDERRAGVSRFDSSSPGHIGWGVAIVPRSIRPLGNQRIGKNEERMLNAISMLHIRGVSNGRFQIDQKSISPRFGGEDRNKTCLEVGPEVYPAMWRMSPGGHRGQRRGSQVHKIAPLEAFQRAFRRKRRSK